MPSKNSGHPRGKDDFNCSIFFMRIVYQNNTSSYFKSFPGLMPFVSSLAFANLLSSPGRNVIASENGHKPVFCFQNKNVFVGDA